MGRRRNQSESRGGFGIPGGIGSSQDDNEEGQGSPLSRLNPFAKRQQDTQEDRAGGSSSSSSGRGSSQQGGIRSRLPFGGGREDDASGSRGGQGSRGSGGSSRGEQSGESQGGGLLDGIRSRLPFGGGDREEASPRGGIGSGSGSRSGSSPSRPGGSQPSRSGGLPGGRSGSPSRPGGSQPSRSGGLPGGRSGSPSRPGGSQPSRSGSLPGGRSGSPSRPGGSQPSRSGSLPGGRSGSPSRPGGLPGSRSGSPSRPGGSQPSRSGGLPGSVGSQRGDSPSRPGGSQPSRSGGLPGSVGSQRSGSPSRPSGSQPSRPGGLPGGRSSSPSRPGGQSGGRSGSPSRPGGSQPTRSGGLPGSVGSQRGGSPSRPGGSQPSRPGGLPGGRSGSPSRPGGQSGGRSGSPSRPGGSQPSRSGGLPGGVGSQRTSSSQPSRPGAPPTSPPRPGSTGSSRSPARPGGVSSSRAAKSPAKGRRTRGKPKPADDAPLLSLDTKLDIIGVALIIVALISILSFLSKEPGAVTRAWLRFLGQFFGWGKFVVPIGIGAIGVWLIWRHFGDQLPDIDPIRIAGVLVLFVGALTFMHAIVAATQPIGPVWVNPVLADPATPDYTPTLIWEEAQACPTRPQMLIDAGWVQQNSYWGSYDIARCGNGGGYIGAFIQVSLQNLIGGAAVFVIALTAIFAGSLMATRKTLKDVLEYGKSTYEKARDKRQAAKPATAYKRTKDGKLIPVEDGKEEDEKGKAAKPASKQDAKDDKKDEKKPGQIPLQGRPSIVTGKGPGGSPIEDKDEKTDVPADATAVAASAAAAAASATPRSVPSTPSPGSRPRPASSQEQPGRPGGAPTGTSQSSQQPARPAAGPPARPPQAGSPASSPGAPPAPGSRPGTPSTTGARPGMPPTTGTRPSTPPRPATGRPEPAARPGIPGSAARPDKDDNDDDDTPSGSGPGGRPPQSRPGSTPPPAASPSARPAQPSSGERPSRPQPSRSPEANQPQAAPGRTFGPSPPASLGGSSRPAPKPSPRVQPETEDDKKDIVFDDLDTVDDVLKDAVDLDENNSPSTDEMIKELVEEDNKPTVNPLRTGGTPPPAGKINTPGSATKPPAASPKPEEKPTPVRPASPTPTASQESKPEATKAGPPRAVKPPAAAAPGQAQKPARHEWQLPSVDQMLKAAVRKSISDEELRQRALIIEQTLSSFGAPARVVEVNHGPVITQFGVEPDYIDGRAGKRTKVKVGKISALADDLALSLAAPSIRIEAPVPGKGFVGVEVPNAEPSIVGLRDVMDTPDFAKLKSPLKMALGQDVSGQPISADLTAMPHLLIAGTTGSGKSVCVNGIIATMLMSCTPDELKMIMVDPKRVELTNYNGIPHLMAPVVTELERIVGVLKWVQREMDDRYRKFAMAGARNITDYNGRIEKGRLEGTRLPYIIVIVDELADLMMLAPDETERVITRLAQMARATGIHIILSTQRPSVDVVTGLIKANFPSRIAFAVATGIDSRVILDMPGAEKLLGRGDMLFQPPDTPMPLRLQGTFVSDEEIDKIVQYWRSQAAKRPKQEQVNLTGEQRKGSPSSSSAVSLSPSGSQKSLFVGSDEEGDDLFDEAVELVRDMGKASISLLQRHLRIGYTRAARLIDLMEEHDVIGPHEGGSKPREVLPTEDEQEDE